MNKKLRNVLMSVYVLSLIIMLSGATYAYFTYIRVSSVSPIVEAKTATVGSILFSINSNIGIDVNISNFKSGMPSLSDEVNASATLMVDGDSYFTEKYYLYLNIEDNPIIYTTNEEYPELMLTVIDPEGNELTELEDLEYKTIVDSNNETIRGFDITTKNGIIYIANNYEIRTNDVLKQEWKVIVTFVNLDSDQNSNMGKQFIGKIGMDKVR